MTVLNPPAGTIIESIGQLQKFYPISKPKLRYKNRYQLLIACILISQSDVQEVNEITESLFEAYPTMEDMARANRKELERHIAPSAFYRRKAKSVQLASQMLLQNYGGEMPDELTDLLKLPGLARKGANLLLTEAGEDPQGIAVDSHVWRVSERLGWAAGKSVESIERQLMKIIPREHWEKVPVLLTEHSERTCQLNDPQCRKCPLNQVCISAKI